jgi:hypothetical protein
MPDLVLSNMAITLNPSEKPFDETDFKKRLIDEYKILQDKIDKIGNFRFTIKGWSVTALIAAAAAGGTAKNPETAVGISVGLAFMLGFFFRFELQQVRLSRLFGARARQLEVGFINMDRLRGKTASAPLPVPYTAHEIFDQKLMAKHASLGPRRASNLWKRFVGWWHIQTQADIFFYIVLIVLAFLA